jgi:hypothetical protein
LRDDRLLEQSSAAFGGLGVARLYLSLRECSVTK